MIPEQYKNLGMELHPKGTILKDEERKVVYIAIPKTGISVFTKVILKKPSLMGQDIFALKNEGYLIITCVREPLERFTSQYFEVIIRSGTASDPKNITKTLPFYNMVNELDKYKQFIEDIGSSYYESHLLPQNYLIRDYESIIDYYFILNNLRNGIKKFNKKFNKKLKPPLRVVRAARNKNLQKKLIKFSQSNKEIYNKIKSRYKNDFELYKRVKKIHG